MRKSLIAPAIAFLAPTALSIYFTFLLNDYNRGLVWDSAHYVLSSQSLLTWLSGCLSGHYVNPSTIDLGPSVMIDGPVLPAFGATFTALGSIFSAPAAASILLGQSLICGLNSLLLFTLGRRLVSTRIALWGALILGLHPSTIISASQFLTEMLTVTVLLSFTLVMTLALPRGRLRQSAETSPLQYVAFAIAGSLAALTLHIKTALFPVVASILLLALSGLRGPYSNRWRGRTKLKLAAAVAAGFFITIVPWLVFSKLASGRITLAPNRVPSINLAVGLDLESDAWGVAPPTESVMPIIFDKPAAIGASLFMARPLAISSLCLRKVERLFACSWNDFNWTFFGLNSYWQNFLQRLILAGALLGAIYIFAGEKLLLRDINRLSNHQCLKIMILLMVAGHLIFIPFETQPRYGYSVLPFLILLALVAAQKLAAAEKFPGNYLIFCLLFILLSAADLNGPLYSLLGTIEGVQLAKNAILAILAGLAIMSAAVLVRRELDYQYNRQMAVAFLGSLAAFGLLTAREYNTAPPEWSTRFVTGLRAEREVILPQQSAAVWRTNLQQPGSWAAIMIDSDAAALDAPIALNGVPATSATAPLNSYEQDYPFQATVVELSKLAAKTRGEAPEDLRQWRMAVVPISALKLDGGPNVLSVTAGSKTLTLYGQYRNTDKRDHKLNIPSLYGFSALRLSMLGDSRTNDRVKRRVASSSSRFTAQFTPDLSPDKPGDQRGDFRIYLILATPVGQSRTPVAGQSALQPSFIDHYWQVF